MTKDIVKKGYEEAQKTLKEKQVLEEGRHPTDENVEIQTKPLIRMACYLGGHQSRRCRDFRRVGVP